VEKVSLLIETIKQMTIEQSLTDTEIFISSTEGEQRATVQNFRATNLADLAEQLATSTVLTDASLNYLRVDIVTDVTQYTYDEAMVIIAETKRNNYFRKGIAFDANFERAFLSEELQGNAILRPSAKHKVGFNSPDLSFNSQNLSGYLKRKYGQTQVLKPEEQPIFLFDTQGFLYENGGWVTLDRAEGHEGLRTLTPVDVKAPLYRSIKEGTRFLTEQIKASGQFIYGYFPAYDYELSGYNSVRHFSSLYALLESYAFLEDKTAIPKVKAAILWGLEHMSFVEGDARFIKEETQNGQSLKLGAQALALLSMSKYQELTGDAQFVPVMTQIINGISGHFIDEAANTTHLLDGNLQTKQTFVIVYYDGEAVFGLLRAYKFTQDPAHLALAQKLFERLVAKGYEKYHDHWLSYATNELLLYAEKSEYYEFGLRNVYDNLRFIEKRDTAYPTMLELVMAAIKMVDKLQASTCQVSKMPDEKAIAYLHEVAHKRAFKEITTGVMWPELAMFMKAPDKIVHGFYTRHDKFRMRIDDAEHYLSGLVNFYAYFLNEEVICH
jgi:hypothetical protein